MADTDWGGIIGTVVLGGMAIKMVNGMGNNNGSRRTTTRTIRKRKGKNKGTTTTTTTTRGRSQGLFGGQNPW